MGKQEEIRAQSANVAATITGLALLRVPFPAHQISKLPKPTKKQTDDVRADFKQGIRCILCGQWHHKDVVHLDYVGHAALTDRLLDCDATWNWEPVAVSQAGTPATDANGGMWIKLTVCGVTRLGYGHADGKQGGDAVKELIGDALRNAAMRFGAALDLWHKGDLHRDGVEDAVEAEKPKPANAYDAAPHIAAIEDAKTGRELLAAIKDEGCDNNHPKIAEARVNRLTVLIRGAQTVAAIGAFSKSFGPDWASVKAEADARTKELTADPDDDEITY
jgi:hypothetical protein